MNITWTGIAYSFSMYDINSQVLFSFPKCGNVIPNSLHLALAIFHECFNLEKVNNLYLVLNLELLYPAFLSDIQL